MGGRGCSRPRDAPESGGCPAVPARAAAKPKEEDGSMGTKRDFLTLADYNRTELDGMLDLAVSLKAAWRAGRREERLAGKALGCVFHKPSLRTRISFEVGMRQL